MTNSQIEIVKPVKQVKFTLDAPVLAEERSRNTRTPWLSGFRLDAMKQFQTQSWPTRKTESWKYTSLVALSDENYHGTLSEQEPASLGALSTESLSIKSLDGSLLVFVDGVYSDSLSKLSSGSAGLICQKFSEADEATQIQIKKVLGQVANSEEHLFANHNDVMLQDGIFLKVEKNTKVDEVLQIVHCSTRQSAPCLTAARLAIVIEEGSELTVVEHFCSTNETQNGFVNSITECVVGENAQLNYYRIHLEDESALHVGGMHVNLLANSRFNGFLMGFGSLLKRIDVVVNHLGPGANCKLDGIYLPKNKQRIDYHTDIQHRAAHCTTSEVFRGIVGDEAKATFNGRIYIHPDAQQTLAELSNKNLLLSNKAEVNSKPELVIYADDVKCAHGATVSQLDGEAIAYMLSRGIDRAQAELMISFGFINELIDSIELVPVRDSLKRVIDAWFGQRG